MKDVEFASPYIKILNDPFDSFARIRQAVKRAGNALFLLCTGGTATSDCAGISAAGASANDRRFTPALDAEALIAGRTFSAEQLPVSPEGIASPVVISRAIVQELLKIDSLIIDAGCFVRPAVDCLRFADLPAQCLSSGAAMKKEHAVSLFEQGVALGKQLSLKHDSLVLAECVPGGTTTALAVLKALGHGVEGMTSSSLPTANHAQKLELVLAGLRNCGLSATDFIRDPLLAVAAVGDPVQASLAGVVVGASQRIPILMGGGSQMLAIWALVQKLNLAHKFGVETENLFVLSTKWVGFDPSAAVGKLAQVLGAPFAVANPNFRNSKHTGLQAYEDGHVKEGAGAGAALCVSFMKDLSHDTVLNAIDSEYDRLINRLGLEDQIAFFDAPAILNQDGTFAAPEAILPDGSFAVSTDLSFRNDSSNSNSVETFANFTQFV